MTDSDAEELRLVNAMIGFCKRMRGSWPEPLRQLGYEACGLEWEIGVLVDGKDKTVCADLICASAQLDHALCVEAKSSIVNEDQAERYRAITRDRLINSAAVPPSVEASHLTHDVVYLTAAANAQKVGAQLTSFNISFPVLSAGDDRFALFQGAFCESTVQAVLSSGIEVDKNGWPTRFVPFTSRSSIAKIFASFATALVALLRRGKPFGIDDIAGQAVTHWKLCGRQERRALREKLRYLLRQGLRGELQGYYTELTEGGKPTVWTPTAQGLFAPHENRRIARQIEEFRKRIVAGREFRELPSQLILFEMDSTELAEPTDEADDFEWDSDADLET